MPDGRVWTAGSQKDQFGPTEPRIEIFEPWYIGADRPKILSSPSAVACGDTFEVATPDPESIQKVVVIRIGSVTHAFNSDQRYIGLQFKGGSLLAALRPPLCVQAPPNENIAPPGYYLLFLVDDQGVPSVGSFLQITARKLFLKDPHFPESHHQIGKKKEKPLPE